MTTRKTCTRSISYQRRWARTKARLLMRELNTIPGPGPALDDWNLRCGALLALSYPLFSVPSVSSVVRKAPND
jgi:hypothetical protein